MKAEKIATIEKATGDTILIFKAIKPLTEAQFDMAANMLRKEEQRSGVTIVLMPHSLEVAEVKEGKPNANKGRRKAGTKDNE